VLCARFITAESLRTRDLPHRLAHAGFDWLLARYRRGLQWVLDHQRLMLGVMLLTLVTTAALFYVTPKGFSAAGQRTHRWRR
jgi:multidrug efflux pump subunit AcrB